MKRIYHTWDKWECYPAGLYNDRPPKGMTSRQALENYAKFLRDIPRFEWALKRVISEWKNSCEHYLSNENMNRIAWLGQASLCIATGIPNAFRGGFNLLSLDERVRANESALKFLNLWLQDHGESALSMQEAQSKTEMDLY